MKEFACGSVAGLRCPLHRRDRGGDPRPGPRARRRHGMTDVPPEVVEQVKANIQDAD